MNRLLYWLAGLAFASLAVLPGCGEKEQQPGRAADGRTAQVAAFEPRLLEIARTYESFGRIGVAANWAPVYCRAPLSSPRLSGSRDTATHGRKLYWLFVKEIPAGAAHGYIPPGGVSRIGQVVVKEAWVPEEITGLSEVEAVGRSKGDRVPYLREDGRWFHAREKAGLFVMFKLDPSTPGTDEGWVYGTVTADGKKVTSSGRVESCRGCHKDAPHDRLFGATKRQAVDR